MASENKTRPTGASVDAFLESVEDPRRREEGRELVALMREVTGEEPVMWGESLVGFGRYHYRYASGREGDFFLAGFSPRKRELSIYVMCGFEPVRELLERLGPHRTGKACLYVKRLETVDRDVLKEIVRISAEETARRHADDG